MVRDPKRLIISTIVGFLLLSGLFGAFGFAAAAEPPNDVPASMTFPHIRVGDRAVYSSTIVENVGLSVAVVETAARAYGFHWLPSTTVLDAEGDGHNVHVLLDSLPPNADENIVSEIAYHFDQGDRSMAAYSYDSSLPGIDRQGQWQAGDPDNYNRQINTVADDEIHTTECPGNTLVGGRTVDLSQPVVLFGSCTFFEYWSDNVRFRPVGMQRIGDVEAVHFASWKGGTVNPDHVVHAWMTDAHPYPIRFAAQSQADPSRFLVYDMQSLRLGNGPAIAFGNAGVPLDLPPVVMAPLVNGFPSEAGVDHAFPVSEAYARAREDATAAGLQNYLEEHPEAVPIRFSGGDRFEDASTIQRWYIEISDLRSSYAFYYSKTTATAPGLVPLLQVTEEETYRFSEVDPSTKKWWPRETIPTEAPTVASVWARWQALAGQPFAAAEPNNWSMSLWCGADDCPGPIVTMSAGHESTDNRNGNAIHYESEIEWRRYQHPDRADTWDMNERLNQGRAQQPGGGDEATQDQQLMSSDLQLSLALWRFPTKLAPVAGAGILSILAAAAYYLWPALKGLGSGMFSRVHDPEEMLQHPVRKAMHEAIQAHPGIHIRKLRGLLETGRGATDHHLRKLESVGLVSRLDKEGYTCLFVKGMTDHRIMQAAPMLKARGAQFLLQAAIKAPGLTGADAARATGLTPGTVNYHMKRLERAGLLELRREAGRVQLWPTAVAQSVVSGSNAVAA